MSRRIVIEEPCEHGTYSERPFGHHIDTEGKRVVVNCPGGSRTVLEDIPEEWLERAGTAAAIQFVTFDTMESDLLPAFEVMMVEIARAVLESVLGDPQ